MPPHGSTAAQPQEMPQIRAGPKVVRIDVRPAAQGGVSQPLGGVHVRLDAGLAAPDQPQMPDGQPAEGDADACDGSDESEHCTNKTRIAYRTHTHRH